MTTEQFSAMLLSWHDFFLLTGTAAATLVGLLFVAVSFNLESLLDDSRTHLMALARQAFVAFFVVLLLSLFLLTPQVSWRVCGVDLAMIGAVIGIPALIRLARIPRQEDKTISRGHMLRLSIGPVIASATLIYVGRGLMRRDMTDFQLVTLAFIALLFTGAGSSWDLLVRVGRAKRQETQLP